MDRIGPAFAAQARACEALGSPFMARLMGILPGALTPGLRRRLAEEPGEIGPAGASLPLRLAGGLHALVLGGGAGDLARAYPPRAEGDLQAAVAGALARHEARLLDWLGNAPQTNEVGRSAVLIAVARELAARFGLPLVLSELGASAGVNLWFDRYRLEIGGAGFGPSGVVLQPDWRGHEPGGREFTVLDRAGCDVNPLDAKADALRLLAYVWPDQPARLSRLRAALAGAEGGHVRRQRSADFVAKRLGEVPVGVCHLIYHTIAHQYFPLGEQGLIRRRIEAAGAGARLDAPLAWFGMEADGGGKGAGLTLRLWPGDLRLDLGRAGFHGEWVEWWGM